jgi:hypothetical protein
MTSLILTATSRGESATIRVTASVASPFGFGDGVETEQTYIMRHASEDTSPQDALFRSGAIWDISIEGGIERQFFESDFPNNGTTGRVEIMSLRNIFPEALDSTGNDRTDPARTKLLTITLIYSEN